MPQPDDEAADSTPSDVARATKAVDWSGYLSWQNVLPPNRPDKQNLLHLRFLAAILAPIERCLILGSTPEYRTELRRWTGELTIVDKSLPFKTLSDDICGPSENEVFVEGDWLDVLPRHQGQFDLIVSHFTHGNVPFARRRDFLRGISGALRHNGVFFDTVFQPPPKLYGSDEIVQRFSNAALNLATYNDFSAFAVFQSDLIRSVGRVDTSKIYDWIATIDCEHIRNIARWTERLVTPRGLSWDYHPDMPPEYFGYSLTFHGLVVFPHEPTSAFFTAASTRVSRKGQS